MSRSTNANCQKPRREPGLSSFQKFRPIGLFRLLILMTVVSASAFVIAGCGASSPRFRSGESGRSRSAARTESTRAVNDSLPAADQDVETSSDDEEGVASGKRSFKTEKNSSITNLDQAKMMREISRMMGVSYKLGGQDENGIDCSAYTMLVYKNSIGKLLPRSSAEQYKIGRIIEPTNLKFGDLVFFDTTGEPASHVGIYLGDDLFAHASVSLGVTISSLESSYFKQRYNGARRVVE